MEHTSRIADLVFLPQKKIASAEGSLLHVLRADSPLFKNFGEVYVSTVMNGAVKAWKMHKLMTQNLVVPHGQVLFSIYDGRQDSRTYGCVQEVLLSREDYFLMQIPPLVWYGFRGMASLESLIVNCASLPHDPDEVERLPSDSDRVPYRWA